MYKKRLILHFDPYVVHKFIIIINKIFSCQEEGYATTYNQMVDILGPAIRSSSRVGLILV